MYLCRYMIYDTSVIDTCAVVDILRWYTSVVFHCFRVSLFVILLREAQGQSWCCTALVFSMLSATFALLIKHCRQAIRVEQTVTNNDPYSVGAMAILKNSMAARTAAVIIANNNGNSNHNYDYTISEETACSTKHAARRQMKNESMISQVRATR